jgi:gamma-glutamyltranspeptidase/glutathione hydrolase/leukotriene-C4 hydrolase
MNDFSIPNTKSYFRIPFSPANIIKPGKRPLSSMCPTIIVNRDGDVQLVIGAAGGPKITSAIAFVRI